MVIAKTIVIIMIIIKVISDNKNNQTIRLKKIKIKIVERPKKSSNGSNI